MSIKGLLTGTGMRLAVATAVISGATLGSQTFKNDSPTFEQSATVVTPAFSPSSLALPDQSSFVAHNTAASTAVSVVAHSTLSSMGSSGASAASPAPSMGSSSGGGSAAGIRVTTPSSAGGGGGSSAGGNGGGSSAGSSMGAASLAMATSSFAASAASAMRAPGGPAHLAEETLEPQLYTGDEPGIILGNDFAESPIVTSYGQPIGDAVLPLMILAMLFGWYVGRKKVVEKLKEVRGR